MSKILLVDDEINALNGLKVLIDFEKYNITTVLTARNAFEALSTIEKEKPEYIITDISMPQMTGLQMISEIQKVAKYMPKIIVLSGFSTFSYAKEALSLGVRAYLLKPCDEDELDDILTKLASEKDEEDTDDGGVAEAESFMLKILGGEKAQKAYTCISEFAGIKSGEYLAICDCSLAFKNSKDFDLSEEEVESTNHKFAEIVSKVLGGEVGVSCFHLNSSEVLFLLHSVQISTDSVKEKIAQACDIAFSSHAIIASAMLSEPFFDISTLEKTYQDCKSSAPNAGGLLSPQVSLLSEETITSEEFKKIYNQFGDLSQNFETIYEEELSQKLDAVFDMAKALDMPQGYFWSIYNAFIINITKYVAELDRDVDKIIDKLAEIKNFSLGGDTSPLKDLVLDLYREMNQNKIHQQNEVFHNIITYVTNNYNENLTLKSLATKFYVNPIYLGRLFKKNTGTLFNEYLTNIRIEKSKVLLEKTTKKIYEIAEEIGFNDPNYFIAKFLKAEGTTPSQYRKKQ